MRQEHDTEIERLMEQIISSGSEDMASVFAGLFDLAMRIEREQFLGAGHYERVIGRCGYANGYKAKKLDTPAGTLSLNVPKTAGHLEDCAEPFYPQSLERGRRSSRAVMLAPSRVCKHTLPGNGGGDVRQRGLDPRRRGRHEGVRH